MKRREFLKQTAFGAGVPIGLGSHGLRWALAAEAFTRAYDWLRQQPGEEAPPF